MSISDVVTRGYIFLTGNIGDIVRAGYSPESVIPPNTIPPSIIRVFRISDFANFAKVGQPIRIQGANFSCLTILIDSETPGNIFINSETPGNILIDS